MRCPSCNAKLPDDSKICPACGKILKKNYKRRRRRRSSNGLVILIAVLCALLLTGFILIAVKLIVIDGEQRSAYSVNQSLQSSQTDGTTGSGNPGQADGSADSGGIAQTDGAVQSGEELELSGDTIILSDKNESTTGDSAGSATGDASGSTAGNATGDVSGSTAGNATGDASGSTAGSATGDASGSTAGNATGDASRNTTGSTSGTSSNDTEDTGMLIENPSKGQANAADYDLTVQSMMTLSGVMAQSGSTKKLMLPEPKSFYGKDATGTKVLVRDADTVRFASKGSKVTVQELRAVPNDVQVSCTGSVYIYDSEIFIRLETLTWENGEE